MKIDNYSVLEKLIYKLKQNEVHIKVVNGNLELKIPKGFNADDILNEVRKNKQKLISYITKISNQSHNFKAIDGADKKDYYVLSSAQMRQYFLQEFDRTSLAYNMPQILKIDGKLDKDHLEEVFRKLIVRHESLRTSFITINQQVVQKISDQLDFSIVFFEAPQDSVSLIIKDFIAPFDLNKAPLFRVGLIKITSQNHILMVDIHHIITDGVSQGVLIRDFMALYDNKELPEIELHYKDYSEWQQSDQYQEELTNKKQFWINEYVEEINVLNLPTDYPRPRVKDYSGNAINFKVNKEQTAALRAIAEKEGATVFMTILAIFNILLSKLSNEEDIVIGTPVSGREHIDLEEVMGMFVNTLVLRNYPQGTLNFVEFLSTVKSKVLSCMENQSYQYENLIEELEIPRDTSRNPLFDVMFSFQNFERTNFEISNLKFTPYDRDYSLSKFDLTLTAGESNEEIYLQFGYSTELFKKETINRFICYFKKILAIIILDSNKKLDDIQIILEIEQNQILEEFNITKIDYKLNRTVAQLFENQVEKSSENIAIIYNKESITYGELNAKANYLEKKLLKRGVVKRSNVPLIMSGGIDYVVSFLAVNKIGACCVPISMHWPYNRLEEALTELNSPIVLVNNSSYEQGNLKKRDNLFFVNSKKLELEKTNLRKKIDLNSPMVMFHTSGTTGKPKCVVLPHKGILNRFMWMNDYFGKCSSQSVLRMTKHIFDSSLWQLFWPLINGGKTIIPLEDILFGINYFSDLVQDYQITMTDFVPTLFNEIVHEINTKGVSSKLDSLKNIVIGGESININTVNQFRKVYPKIRLTNLYGPTEASIGCIYYPIDQYEYDMIPIGRPISNMKAFILDHNNNLLPQGVAGELHIGGVGLARGYYRSPKLTKKKFIKNPFMGGERLYKTGDLARWLSDGNIEFLDRIDNQVKIRGFRIELGEIQSQLSSHSQLRESVVVVNEKEGDKYLIAYYVSEEEVLSPELRNYLSERLPDYMLPSYYVHLGKIPLTASGKINFKNLPVPKLIKGEDYMAPSGQVEKNLVAIWAEVLKIDRDKISVNRSFFELGGHSLKAMLLVNKILEIFNIKIPLVDIFSSPTISNISNTIQQFRKLSIEVDYDIVLLKKDNASNKNLFLIHDVTGEIHGYLQFCQIIENYNCWGIRSTTLKQLGPINLKIEEIAKQYIIMLKSVQPNEPYLIGGWSFGGIIAYEITCQLEEEGNKVIALLLIDSILEKNKEKERKFNDFSLNEELILLSKTVKRRIFEMTNSKSIEELWEVMARLCEFSKNEMYSEILKKNIPKNISDLIPNFEYENIRNIISATNTIRSLINAIRRYKPVQELNTKILYMKASETKYDISQLSMYSKNKIISSEIEGDHFSILKEPQVCKLMNAFKSKLTDIENVKERDI